MSEALANDEMEPPSVPQRLIEGIPYGAYNLTGPRRLDYIQTVQRYIGQSVVARVYDAYFAVPDDSANSLDWIQVEVAQQNLTGQLLGSAEPTELVFDVDGSEFTASATGLMLSCDRQFFVPLQFLAGLYTDEVV